MNMHRTQGVAAAHVLFLPALLILLFEQCLPREPIAPCDITLDFFGSWLMLPAGLCQRRHWPDPQFQTYRSGYGYGCTVRVNNREYSTDVDYESDELAKNAAATRAYMICRNFSVNDG